MLKYLYKISINRSQQKLRDIKFRMLAAICYVIRRFPLNYVFQQVQAYVRNPNSGVLEAYVTFEEAFKSLEEKHLLNHSNEFSAPVLHSTFLQV